MMLVVLTTLLRFSQNQHPFDTVRQHISRHPVLGPWCRYQHTYTFDLEAGISTFGFMMEFLPKVATFPGNFCIFCHGFRFQRKLCFHVLPFFWSTPGPEIIHRVIQLLFLRGSVHLIMPSSSHFPVSAPHAHVITCDVYLYHMWHCQSIPWQDV